MTLDPTVMPPRRAFSGRGWKLFLILLVPFLLFTCLADATPLILIYHLAVGWLPYLTRVVPQAYVSLPGLLTAAALLALGHGTAAWIYRETAQPAAPPRRWKFCWTAAATATLLLLFASGTALVGITHQSTWLARSDQPLFQSSRVADRVRCMSNLRQIGQALILHANEHDGRFPASLDQVLDEHVLPYALLCPNHDHDFEGRPTTREITRILRQARGTYVFLTPNLTLPTDRIAATNLPVVCEPLANHAGRGMNILFADGSVEWHTPDQAAQILNPR